MLMVLIYTGLGQKDKAFEWLERAYEARAMGIIKAVPTLDPLRSDPRFADLLRRMNLQPEHKRQTQWHLTCRLTACYQTRRT